MSRRRRITAEEVVARARRARAEDARDHGNRPGVATALGFAVATPPSSTTHDATNCDVFGCTECLSNQGVA